jgi:hypothetical protein
VLVFGAQFRPANRTSLHPDRTSINAIFRHLIALTVASRIFRKTPPNSNLRPFQTNLADRWPVEALKAQSIAVWRSVAANLG